jgi:hypothetical protein
LRVHYDKLGLRFQTYRQWIASGGHVPRPEDLRSSNGRLSQGARDGNGARR